MEPKPYNLRRKDFSTEMMHRISIMSHIGGAYFSNTIKSIREYRCAHCTQALLRRSFALCDDAIVTIYETVYGPGSFAVDLPESERKHMAEAYEEGKALGQRMKEVLPEGAHSVAVQMLGEYSGPFPEDFKAGLSDELGAQVLG